MRSSLAEEKMASPKAQVVKRFREATGMGWMESKLFLAGRSADLCERILRAGEEQKGARTLHDPIEDDPEFAEIIKIVRDEAEAEIRRQIADAPQTSTTLGSSEWPRGTCHRLWRDMKSKLAEKGITWYSLADMNPGHCFD